MTPDLSRLPALAPEIAALLARLAASHWQLPVAGGAAGGVPALDVRFAPGPSPRGNHVEIEAETGFGTARLSVEAGLVDRLSDALLPGWRDEDGASLPMDWRAVLALEAVADGMGLAGLAAARARVRPAPAASDGPPLSRLEGTVEAGGGAFTLSLDLSDIGAAALEALDGRHPHGRLNRFDPGFRCRLRLAGRPARLAAYRALAAGDTLLAGTLCGGRLPARLEVPGVASFAVRLDPASGALDSFENAGRKDTMADNEDDLAQAAEMAGAIADTPPLEDPVEDLPVRLDFLLSTRRISLGELRALGPGATLDLRIDLAQPVTILANGAPAAKGYLVQIGDHVGVQIDRWPGMEGATKGGTGSGGDG